CREVCRPSLPGRKTSRPSGRAADEIRLDHQPQDRQGPRPHDPAGAAGAGGSGHPVVDRRRFLLTSLAGALAAPLAATAQPAGERTPRIGYLDGAALSAASVRIEALRQGLRERGYVEGQNIAIEWRSAEGKADRLPGLAAE